MICLGRPYHLKNFKGCLPQISLDPFLNTLTYMTNYYPFIQVSLESLFSELFFSDVSLWNQYKYIAFNIFSCRILIISCKC